ncbi:MAG: NAD-dependent epimerase/dehydratase family protein [Fimbriimonadaceae bacterium]|nr:NAD-dependent epimerase/dehydratase family protein [Fimbriimonadaceae bacterium]
MRIVVTGAAGFLGSHLCDALHLAGHEIVAMDNLSTGRWDNLPARPGLTRLTVDVANPIYVEGKVDRIFHFASPASPRDFARVPVAVAAANSLGAWNALHLAKEKGARIVMASTSEVYGDPLVSPQPESYWGNTNPVGPRSCYDESKRFSEALTRAFALQYGSDAGIVRIFNTYGPRMRRDDGRAVPTFLDHALRREPIPVQGDGLQTRSFAYVADVVAGVIALMESGYASPLNLGNDEEVTILELAEAVIQATGSESPIVHVPAAPDDPRQRKPDLTLARRLLGYEPRIGLREGLAATLSQREGQLAS